MYFRNVSCGDFSDNSKIVATNGNSLVIVVTDVFADHFPVCEQRRKVPQESIRPANYRVSAAPCGPGSRLGVRWTGRLWLFELLPSEGEKDRPVAGNRLEVYGSAHP